jgi:hypothetical protein
MILMILGLLQAAEEAGPFPRARLSETVVREWGFEGTEGWTAAQGSRVTSVGGSLRVEATGEDPYAHGPVFEAEGPLLLRFRARSATGGELRWFWELAGRAGFAEERAASVRLKDGGAWTEGEVDLGSGAFRRLRVDLESGAEAADLDTVRLVRAEPHPLRIVSLRRGAAVVRNEGGTPRTIRGGILRPGATMEIPLTPGDGGPFAVRELRVASEGLPDLVWTAVQPELEAFKAAAALKMAGAELRIGGGGIVIALEGRPAALIAPIVSGARDWTVDGATLRAPGVTARFAEDGGWIRVTIEADREVEGPVLRALGALETGLFAGIEHLGKGERSSSRLDLETPDHVRYAPDPIKVTMPLMACATAAGSAALLWRDPGLQPVFAAPNVFDGSDDQRMALKGRKIEAWIRVAREPFPATILEAVRKHGLPEAPAPSASTSLCRLALEKTLRSPEGWGHCAEPSWKREPFADHASALWRLTGVAPELPRLVPGGAHLPDDAVYLVTGRGAEWAALRRAQAEGVLREQRPDGSWRYGGPLGRGHFEDTASGLCATKAVALLEHARLTGHAASLAGGLKALEFLRRFRVPRGAQTWEMPLHTPDLLGAGYLVWAHVLGWELTGNREWLERARDWAVLGVPYLYLRSSRPVMTYATIAVLGATQWKAPNWIGLPVQWCGITYGYALALLAKHDVTLDWTRIAQGIRRAGEQMLDPEGARYPGCLPDSYELSGQRRQGPYINPCALMMLGRALDGETPALCSAGDDKLRVASPWPLELRDGKAVVRAKAGTTYQLVVDGARVIPVTSKGVDEVPLR